MARYRIVFGNVHILVPFDSTRTNAELGAEATRRLQQRVGPLPEDGLELLLGALNGPFLDPVDRLEDVILDSERDWIFAVRRSDSNASVLPTPQVPNLAQVSLRAVSGLTVRHLKFSIHMICRMEQIFCPLCFRSWGWRERPTGLSCYAISISRDAQCAHHIAPSADILCRYKFAPVTGIYRPPPIPID